MSLTVILADYLSGSISTNDALRRSGFAAIDQLVNAVRAESDRRAGQRGGGIHRCSQGEGAQAAKY